jgi:hypothetical protein
MAWKNSAATRSAAEAALVGWPLPAAVVARIDQIRRRVATSSSPRTNSSTGVVMTFMADSSGRGLPQAVCR